LAAATNLTIPKRPDGQKPTMVVVTAEAQTIRWRDDGTSPTATIGMPLAAGSSMNYDGDLNNIQFIQATAGGILNCAFYA
jgi:hypothetical protein